MPDARTARHLVPRAFFAYQFLCHRIHSLGRVPPAEQSYPGNLRPRRFVRSIIRKHRLCLLSDNPRMRLGPSRPDLRALRVADKVIIVVTSPPIRTLTSSSIELVRSFGCFFLFPSGNVRSVSTKSGLFQKRFYRRLPDGGRLFSARCLAVSALVADRDTR